MESNIKDYPNYHVTTDGTVYNLKLNKGMSLQKSNSNYVQVLLRNDKVRTCFTVHRLVALAYIANPLNHPQVNHIDGNKSNNHVSNLEWCTASENKKHAHSTGLTVMPKGIDSSTYGIRNEGHSKAVKATCLKTGNTFEFPSAAEAERQRFARSRHMVSACTNGLRNSHNGYTWVKISSLV